MLFKRLGMIMNTSREYSNGHRCYSGKYQDGHAVYFYDDSPDGRIYDGKFWFSRTFFNETRSKVTETAQGLFNSGTKEGLWTFSYKSHGVTRRLTVQYSGGQRAGNYCYRSVCQHSSLGFSKGEVMMSGMMRKGMLVGDIRCVFNGEILTGCFDSEGRPDGAWVMDSSKSFSHRIVHETWEHGECMSSYAEDVTTGDIYDVKNNLPDIIASVVYNECKPLEKIMRRGS